MKLLICTQVMDTEHPILGFFHAWVLEFAKHFERIDVICLEQGNCELPAHVHVHSLGKEAGASKLTQLFRYYRFFFRYGHRANPAYVFFHMGAIMNILAAPFYFARGNTRYIWWKAHGHIDRQGQFALRFCDHVFTSTASGFPIETPKRHIVGQAIQIEHFQCNRSVERKAKRILFTGRVMPVKHLEVFISVVAELRKRGHEVEGRIIGPLDDTAYVETLRDQLQAHKLSEDMLVGPLPQSELVSEYCRASIFLNPSLTHSMDKTVLEAILCGCIPLTANQAFRSMLEDQQLWFAENSVQKFADRIEVLLQQDDPTLRQKLHQEVMDDHSLHTFPQRILSHLQ